MSVCIFVSSSANVLTNYSHFTLWYRDVKLYPKARVTVMVKGEMQAMMVGLAPRLAYPVILGRDWRGFAEVLRAVNLGVPTP